MTSTLANFIVMLLDFNNVLWPYIHIRYACHVVGQSVYKCKNAHN